MLPDYRRAPRESAPPRQRLPRACGWDQQRGTLPTLILGSGSELL